MKDRERAAASFRKGSAEPRPCCLCNGERFALDSETALRVAGDFGGMARTGETCGAVTGVFMVIGLKHGKTRADNDEARERTYELANELVRRFRAGQADRLPRTAGP